MEEKYIRKKRPEILVFAGPNGSGKSTITSLMPIIPPYINADEIQKDLLCSNEEAANKADELRQKCLQNNEGFTFETVLSTDRKLDLLREAKAKGYFIRCIYVLTADPWVNIFRVHSRKVNGGHDVPQEKVITRYYRALERVPELLELCDICHIYDNTVKPFRIFKKRKTESFYWENALWDKEKIFELTKSENMRIRGY